MIDELIYLTNLVEGMFLQQRLRAQGIEKDLNQIRLQLLRAKVKALWVEQVEDIVPPKRSVPIPIPSAKIKEVEGGYVSEFNKPDWKENDKVKGMYTYSEKEKPITKQEIN